MQTNSHRASASPVSTEGTMKWDRWDAETLVCSLPWFFLVPTMGALHSKELPLPHIAKFKELATETTLMDKAQSFWGPNKLTQHLCSESQISSGSHSFYRKQIIFPGRDRDEKIHWSLLCGLNLAVFFFECFLFRMEEREAALFRLPSSVLHLCNLFLSCPSSPKCCHHQHDSRTASHMSFCCQSKTALRRCVERTLVLFANVIRLF